MTGKTRRPGGPPLSAVPSGAATTGAHDSTVESARAAYYGERLVQYAASGVNVQQAAQLLELPESTARRYYAQALAAVAGLTDAQKREQLQLDLETIRLLVQAHMPHAIKGKVGSAQIVLAAMRERANRLGLDAAIQVNISNQAIGEAVEDVVEIIDAAAPIELPPLPALPPMPGEEGAAG